MKTVNSVCNNGGFELGCYIYEPENRNSVQLPLIVFLHGVGERGNGKEELEKLTSQGLPKYIQSGKNYPAVILMPQCPQGMVWNNIVFALKELIDKVVAEYNIDTDRISITGLSMGGFGTWEMGLSFPDFFSAIAPICGGGLSFRCSALKDTPVWAFHGDMDTAVPIQNSIEMVDAVNKAGGKARLTILHGVGHYSWEEAYNDSNLIEWLITQRKHKG